MLVVLVRVVQFLIALFFLRLVVHTTAALLRPAEPRAPGRPADAALVRDRQCNTYIPRRTALRATVRGSEEFFCSTACRDRALSGIARAS